jgi:hypothetical protein
MNFKFNFKFNFKLSVIMSKFNLTMSFMPVNSYIDMTGQSRTIFSYVICKGYIIYTSRFNAFKQKIQKTYKKSKMLNSTLMGYRSIRNLVAYINIYQKELSSMTILGLESFVFRYTESWKNGIKYFLAVCRS